VSLRGGRPVLPVVILLVIAAWLWFVDARTLIPTLVIQMATLLFAGSGSGSGPASAGDADPGSELEHLHEVMSRSWGPLAAANRFLDPEEDGAASGTGAVPPRVLRWPRRPLGSPGPWAGDGAARLLTRWNRRRPVPTDHLSAPSVAFLVEHLARTGRTLVVHGRQNSGTGTALLSLFTAAQAERTRRRALGEDFPLPVWVSLAGWHPDDTDLHEWVIDQLGDRYPELFAGQASLERALRSVWLGETTDRLMLFLDDGEGRVDQALRAAAAHVVAVAARPSDLPRPGCDELQLEPVTEDDVRRFLGGRFAGVKAAARAGRLSPRRLSLLRDLRAVPRPLLGPATQPPEVADVLLAALWPPPPDDVPRRRPASPGRPDRRQVESTVRWISGQRLFAGAGFAWWLVPQLARAAAVERLHRDPAASPENRALARAYRQVIRGRARSAAAWALVSFALGVGAVTLLAVLGVIQGYDQAGHGLGPAHGLGRADVEQWVYLPPPRWGWGWVFSLPSANPLVLVVMVSLLVAGLIGALARFGGELGGSLTGDPHRIGHPQTIRPAWPGLRELPALARGVGGRRALLLTAGVLGAASLPALGVGDRTEWWPGVVYTATLVAVLAWLRWCTGPEEPLSAVEAMESERGSSRTVAVTVGGALSVASAGLTWWFSASGAAPTLQQAVWIAASVGMSVGVARGVSQGAGMGLPWSPWRPGLGLGYAERLARLEEALHRQLARGDVDAALPLPFAVTGLLHDLNRPVGADGLHTRMLLRPVGTLIRPRDPAFDLFDPDQNPHPLPIGPPEPAEDGRHRGAAARHRRRGVRAAFTGGVLGLGLVLASSGVFPAAVPRVPCRGGVDAATLIGGLVSPRQVWLENGQCVGFVVPSSGTSGFGQLGRPPTRADQALDAMLARIAAQNDRIDPGRGDQVRTVAFLAPLSRSLPGNPINALFQLSGAAAAQEAINAAGGTQVRLVVVNSGDNFVSGPSVAQALRRTFSAADAPASDGGALRALVGLSQSRASTLESVHVLTAADPQLRVVAASVNGSTMRSGGTLQLGAGDRFRSVAPGDHRVARAMLRAVGDLGLSGGVTLHVLFDGNDTFFSNELRNALKEQAAAGPAPVTAVTEDRFDETAGPGRAEELARSLCASTGRNDVWMFAGRGAQLRQLGDTMNDLRRRGAVTGPCAPHVVAGPGGLSVFADPDTPRTAGTVAGPDGPWQNLLFYSLATGDDPATGGGGDGGAGIADAGQGPARAAQESDRRTGYASLLEAMRELPGVTLTCGTGLRAALGLSFTDAEPDPGHNTLGAGPADGAGGGPDDGGCGVPQGSRIYFCPVDGSGCGLGYPAEAVDPTAPGRRS